jgi:hypothetical protein
MGSKRLTTFPPSLESRWRLFRFKIMFAELTSFKNHDHSVQTMPQFLTSVDYPNPDELDEKQGVIDSLVKLRYKEEENDFLHITEMTSFQKFEIYTDSYPLFKLRMKIWRAYK